MSKRSCQSCQAEGVVLYPHTVVVRHRPSELRKKRIQICEECLARDMREDARRLSTGYRVLPREW